MSFMGDDANSREAIKERIKTVLDNVAVDGLRAWLRSVDLHDGSSRTRATITDHVAKIIAQGKLTEPALEKALIGFEESSDMRIYLFRMDEVPSGKPEDWLPTRLKSAGIVQREAPIFAGDRAKPMSPVYAHLEGGLLRVKWAEQQQRSKLNDRGDGVEYKPFFKRIVVVADFLSNIVELRLNPPENIHAYTDGAGRSTADAYYASYAEKAQELLGCKLLKVELRPVVRKLVEQEDPRVIRIHIDTHTNQSNNRMKTNSSRSDIRDDPDWQLAYRQNGEAWAWEAQSFYWLPKVSSGFLTREVFSHIDAEEAYVKVNADCSDKEVNYVVTQIREREAS